MHSYRANVNRKHCAYFRCNNNSVSTPDITFFGFPKPFDRYETWMKFAGVPHELLENKRYRYLCERHFADIYMCRSQRRTLLLGNAVPYPFDQSIVTDCDASEGTVEVYEMESDGTLAKVAPLRPLDDNEGAELTDMEQTSETDTEALSSPTVTVVRSSTSEELQDTLSVEEVPVAKKDPQKEEPKPDAVSSAGSSHKQKLVASKIAEMKVKVRNTAAAGAITPNHREAAGKRVVLNGKTIRLVPIQFRNIMHKQSETDPEVTIVDNDHEDGGKPDEASGEVPNASKSVKSPVSSSTNSHDETVEGREDEPAESSAGGQQATERDDKISEFIFKGEEYVQMPKAHFVGKLSKLEQRVAHYESVIRNMRSILDHASPFGSTDG